MPPSACRLLSQVVPLLRQLVALICRHLREYEQVVSMNYPSEEPNESGSALYIEQRHRCNLIECWRSGRLGRRSSCPHDRPNGRGPIYGFHFLLSARISRRS
jgi:hypothetical protein